MRAGGVFGVLVVLALGGAGAWWRWGRAEEAPTWRTAAVERQDVRQVVSATGPLEAVQTVEVGAQVSGIVAALGADFNDRVTKGQVLARIDPALLEADVASAEARLAEARAQEGRLALALERVEKLHPARISTDDELDAARAEHDVAVAQVRAAEVALSRAKRNLGYATIRAPIDGTVVRRDVEVGQTVNAGLSAPKLFLIAGDLARMQILAAVDESDIGRIHEGQTATFTVQAYPDRTFAGKVRQVRLQSSTVESVVTYTVVVEVDNADGVLLPGMTATVEFEVAKAEAALCVPSAALRYAPGEGVVVASTGGGEEGRRGGGKRRGGDDAGTLYLAEGAALRPLPVQVGLRGATCVQVSGDGVAEGVEVVTGVERKDAGAATSPLGGGSGGSGQRRPGGF